MQALIRHHLRAQHVWVLSVTEYHVNGLSQSRLQYTELSSTLTRVTKCYLMSDCEVVRSASVIG